MSPVALLPLILASASPRRLQLLQQIGITPHQVIVSSIDETPHKNESPPLYAKRIAMEKALAVAAKHPDAIILAADTVVACGRRILPKAEDENSVRKCLQLLSGRRHRVMTAICLKTPKGLSQKLMLTQVQFSRLREADITQYIASREWDGKAGGYAIQGLAAGFIPRINGSYSNVVGLPLAETLQMLKQAGAV